jgi:hypothetical protein
MKIIFKAMMLAELHPHFPLYNPPAKAELVRNESVMFFNFYFFGQSKA